MIGRQHNARHGFILHLGEFKKMDNPHQQWKAKPAQAP